MKRFILQHGLCRPKGPFPRNNQNRCFSPYFYGEDTAKFSHSSNSNTWLCYSQSQDIAYCQFCWLFSSEHRTFDTRDWQGLSKKVKEHAMSAAHIQACITGSYWKKHKTVDHKIDLHLSDATRFWRDILIRLVEIILTITRNNIALRGTTDQLGAISNGNFLSQVELLAKFDVAMNTLVSKKKKRSY